MGRGKGGLVGGVMDDMDGSFTRTGANCVVLVNVCNVYIFFHKGTKDDYDTPTRG